MPTLDSLPADQRAVLQLVLQRGRSYDQIATTLTIDRSAVRQRALDALDSLSPDGPAPNPAERSLITDYLLGQLPERVAEQVYGLLATSPTDRDWAESVADELETFANGTLPAIPDARAVQDEFDHEHPAPHEFDEPHADAPNARATTVSAASPRVRAPQRRSRRGGRVLLALISLAVVIAVVLILVLDTGSSKNSGNTTTTGRQSTATTPKKSAKKTSSGVNVLAQLNLNQPDGGAAKGIAEVVREQGVTGLVIYATHVPANSKHNAYAVWLSNSEGDSKFIGFVPKLVGKNGKLQTEGKLPANATQYKHLLITRETTGKPTHPGVTVLSSRFRETAS